MSRAVHLVTFGYKHACPPDADLLIDVRELPNPYYEPALAHLTGADTAVVDYFVCDGRAAALVRRYADEVEGLLRGAAVQSAPLRVAIGCTGGQHRSVYFAETLAAALRERGVDAAVGHRELKSQ